MDWPPLIQYIHVTKYVCYLSVSGWLSQTALRPSVVILRHSEIWCMLKQKPSIIPPSHVLWG